MKKEVNFAIPLALFLPSAMVMMNAHSVAFAWRTGRFLSLDLSTLG